MCDCLKELEKSLDEKFKKDNPDATVKDTYFVNSAWIQRGIKDGKVQMPLELTAKYLTKYSTVSSKGKEINRKSEVDICFKYCPFCGKQLEEGVSNDSTSTAGK